MILETLLNLHTSGWLHKELCSDNVVLLEKSSANKSIPYPSTNLSNYFYLYSWIRLFSD
ncbi:hypothetical protein GQ44DRAFT_716113 [Phaeosphaeriaceae sp. PMI808]|nr:hypothetical protein GQ44DRAFT_716113 [Phaeosphaeriaceae sp. PMI808]